MHFKRLALRNFRNFQGDVEVWFTETANAIVGSNGAGKSNILLAIAFVLDCDKKFLDVRNEIHFINEGHMLAEPGTSRNRNTSTTFTSRDAMSFVRTANEKTRHFSLVPFLPPRRAT